MNRLVRIGARLVLSLMVFGVVSALVFKLRTRSQGTPLATTECTMDGPVFRFDTARIASEDRIPVAMHEDVHGAQCRARGWLRMRLANLTASGKLSLEAPGYCEGARARLRRGDDFHITRERMFDDANAMFAGIVDSSRVNAELRAYCPEIARPRAP